MSEHDTADSFVAKWRQRWPEWSIAEAFVPASRRPSVAAWLALLDTLTEAAWGGADPTPGLAKLAWWHEELEGWARGARRHPLGTVLQRLPAPWTQLGRTLNVLPDTRGRDAAAALEALSALSSAVAACEAALFPDARTGGEGSAHAGAGLVLVAERALLTASQEDAGWLLARWPRPVAGALPRRLHGALVRTRLDALARGRPVAPAPGWRVLAMSWRASRGR